ncbi:hypothetical protein HS7_08380 [Sulfolobales archaeon HS-7]|nr:hypothetical protein HS7_08380 [Sulfolobales archaeon HS-7]
MTLKVSKVILSAFIYETEDPELIVGKIDRLLEGFNSNKSMRKVDGYYRTSIGIVEYVLEKKEASYFFKKILKLLDKNDLYLLLATYNEKLDRSRLHLRFDKQKFIALDKLSLTDKGDVIKVIVSLNIYKNDSLIEELKQNVFN